MFRVVTCLQLIAFAILAAAAPAQANNRLKRAGSDTSTTRHRGGDHRPGVEGVRSTDGRRGSNERPRKAVVDELKRRSPELAGVLGRNVDLVGRIGSSRRVRGAILRAVKAANAGDVHVVPTPKVKLTKRQRGISEGLAKKAPADRPLQPADGGHDPVRQQKAYVDHLYRQAKQARDQLRPRLRTLAGDSGGSVHWRPEMKNRQRADSKIETSYGGDPRRITDLVAAKIVYRDLDQLYTGLSMIAERFDGRIEFFQDRFVNPMKSGYADCKLVVRADNGHLVEIQMHVADFVQTEAVEHHLYEVSRQIKADARAETRPLTRQEQNLIDALTTESRLLYQRVTDR